SEADHVRMRIAIRTDVARRQHDAAHRAVKTIDRLHDVATFVIRSDTKPGTIGNAGCRCDEIGFRKGKESSSQRVALALIKIAREINRVAIDAKSREICEVAGVRVRLKNEAVPVALRGTRIRAIRNREQ